MFCLDLVFVNGFKVHWWISPLLCCGNSPGDGGGWPADSFSRGSVEHAIARKLQWFWPPTYVSVDASKQCEYDSTSSRPGCTQQLPNGHLYPCSTGQAASSALALPLCSPERTGGTPVCPFVGHHSVPSPQVDRHKQVHEAQRTGTAAAQAASPSLAKYSNLDSSAP